MTPKAIERKTVLVEWADADSSGGWKTAEQIAEMTLAEPNISVGFLVKNDDEVLVIAQTYAHDNDDNNERMVDFLTIPASVVKKVTRLK